MKTSTTNAEQSLAKVKESIFFSEGIVGFDEHKKYAIVAEKSKEPFYWMQSKKDEAVSFIVIDPKEFMPEYNPILTDVDKEALKVTNTEECLCCAIVSVPENSDKISANLLAPIFINHKKNIGRQVILQNQNYDIQHLILEEMLKNTEEKNVSSFAKTK